MKAIVTKEIMCSKIGDLNLSYLDYIWIKLLLLGKNVQFVTISNGMVICHDWDRLVTKGSASD